MSTKVYVAGPYSKGDVEGNVRRAIYAANKLWAAGFVAFVPHITHLWNLIAPHPYEDWIAWDLVWVEACDYLIRLEGESPGADREVAFARERGIPVYHGVDAFLRAVCGPAKEHPDGP
jgi:hypothetical protein